MSLLDLSVGGTTAPDLEQNLAGCGQTAIIKSIFENISKIELQLVHKINTNQTDARRFLNDRLRYYEKMLREVTGLETLP